MGEIYCLYSPIDGVPRYVGKAEKKARARWAHHVAMALKKKEGPLYDWIRSLFERQLNPEYHVLQSNIIPADLDMFECYWMEQFEGLFNIRVGKANVPAAHSEVGEMVISVIKGKLALETGET